MSKKLSLSIEISNFPELIEKLHELSSIDDTIKIKIKRDFILMYSIMGNEGQVSAMKCFLIETKKFIKNFDESESFDFVLTSSGKFVKNIKFFNVTKPIKLEIVAKQMPDDDDVYQIRTIHLSNGKLKISSIGSELHKIKDLNKNFIDTRLDLKKSRWGFTIQAEDFSDIKKLSSINSDDRILSLSVLNKKIYFSEISKWELEVDQIDVPNQSFMFNKKYLSYINTDSDSIKFNIFDNFILIKDDESNLMLSFEQDFSNDD